MSINEIITRVENDELYMFLAVEIFVVAQSVNVYIYLCVCYRVLVWMCVNVVCLLFVRVLVLSCCFFFFVCLIFFFDPAY